MSKIKLIIVDFYGVLTLGSYRETCQWKAKKFGLDYDKVYKIFYFKYFNKAALGKITERQSFELPLKELGLNEDWQKLRRKHLSFQKLNKPVFRFFLSLQNRGFRILLLSKNTPRQFKETVKRLRIRRYFKTIINTFDLRLPKASPKMIKYVLAKFKIQPGEAVFVDDQDFNLAAPRRLGVHTILYKNFRDLKRRVERLLYS